MQKWEYLHYHSTEINDPEIGKLGSRGWELITIYKGDDFNFLFKRPRDDERRRWGTEDDRPPYLHEGHWSLTQRLNVLKMGDSIEVSERLWPDGTLTHDKDSILGRGGGRFQVEQVEKGYRFTRVKEGNI